MKHFHYQREFETETGAVLPKLTVAYQTYGHLNDAKNNVVWICHALTANANVVEWWPGVVGENCVIDPSKYFIVCANILGSCYGSTGPLSINPKTGEPYYHQFPMITIRDMVKAHGLLRDHLQIQNIYLLIGGSMGGYQALEWCLTEPERIENMFLIATSARETAWGIAIHTAQRLAIEADCTWNNSSPEAGSNGLKTARAIGMLTYRNYNTFKLTQTDTDNNKTDHFKASSYIIHQGNKLVKRFNAFSYWFLTKALDSHNLARGRSDSLEEVLKNIRQKTLLIGVRSDLLCPLAELEFLAQHLPENRFHVIDSVFGHDGFLTEYAQIARLLSDWLQ
ncbi:homoserine O-acetyltransferase MetX [Flavisolibacter ginsenosidimutans]|uniref:Homoserine O-acetyltransferase n=1 Tax=Flavisolibacter ginsenosidimutans TaxID=661481 RepID=A0A5B8UHT6_9BACT|nr:homoserine O-acetyltransferase [Flavisolibacter ginsenosidimutans]QEC55906.1 homoserine O-acetyltransferase [Flavisolibacter ginsenosidimutans]